MLWRMRGDLQTVESTPGNAGHANVSIAPLLGGKPFDHFADVELFPWRIFVVEHAFGIAAAAQVKANAHVSSFRHVSESDRIVDKAHVILAVWNGFQHNRKHFRHAFHHDFRRSRHPHFRR